MIIVGIGKIIHGVVVLGRSYYGSFYIWGCCNRWVVILPIVRYVHTQDDIIQYRYQYAIYEHGRLYTHKQQESAGQGVLG